MSFDLFVDRFEAGRSTRLKIEIFEQIFGRHEAIEDGSFRRLVFEDGEADAYLNSQGYVMFNHFGGEQFFNCLFQYLQETRSVAYWPGADRAAAVTDPTILPELPADMTESLRPALMRSAAEWKDAVLR